MADKDELTSLRRTLQRLRHEQACALHKAREFQSIIDSLLDREREITDGQE
jgi:hypothetical protein